MPRQFNVSVVECGNTDFIDKAKWLFPLYLLVINIFTLPVALVGILQELPLTSADLWLLSLPLSNNQTTISILVLLGGFAARTGMIMISAMTLSTMLTNHLMMPAIMNIPRLSQFMCYILQIR